MREMSHDEWRQFVMEGARTGKLATTAVDGAPRIKPIWFHLDGDEFLFNTGDQSAAGRALRRDPRAALCVDDETPPFAYVIVHGQVRIVEDLTQVREWATRIAGRYMGAELAEEYGARNGVPGELLVRLVPDRVIAHARIAD